jgi:hypothetical protein
MCSAWRDTMRDQSKAPKILNGRISPLSSFYKYLAGAAAELRLPINVPNPALSSSSCFGRRISLIANQCKVL